MMPWSFGHRAAAQAFVLLLLGCAREAPAAPPEPESPSWAELLASALDEARSTQRELLLWIDREQDGLFSPGMDRARKEQVAAAIGDGGALGVVPAMLLESMQPTAPASMVGLFLPSPGIGQTNDEPPTVGFRAFAPMLVFADADGRPVLVTDEASMTTVADAQRTAEAARDARRGRDAGFAAAAMLEGSPRAAELKRALAALDRWIVVRCYAVELEALTKLGDDSVRDWAAPLLQEHRILQACVGLQAASQDLSTANPRRVARQLAVVTKANADLPEVAMLAACMQGAADLRLAVDDDDRRRILARVEVAVDAVDGGPWRDLGRAWLLVARR